MKKLLGLLTFSVLVAIGWACSDSKDRFVDLSTGKSIEIEKDGVTGFMVNKETGEVPYIYVDTKKKDTIYGKTGKVINGHVVLGSDNKYVYDEDEKLEIDANGGVEYKDGDHKTEIEKDGDVTIKDGDNKVKIDGETGERKVKKD
ncbi:MAG: hypothetical protein SGI83_12265 [Bacteroidota bacterium]|nr:hypothetical protein [Bacteroidota bacterium]